MGFQSAERVSQTDLSDNFVFRRSELAYHKAREIVSGETLEIGTGSGYGISIVSPVTSRFLTVDKFSADFDFTEYSNVEFRRMTVPPLEGIESESFDFVISFQVIEHIRRDDRLLEDIKRVLKPGGKLVITTPNKLMSLTRNPWHVREYTPASFVQLLEKHFSTVDGYGVFGKENVKEYYERNRESVRKITRFDILRLQWWLPRFLLQIPYDLLNRINRRKLLEGNRDLTSGIRMEDYYIDRLSDECYDLFFVATK